MFTTLIVKGLTVFLTKMMVTVASEKVIAYTFFSISEAVVKSTTNEKDNAWLEQVKEVYNKQ